MVVVEQRDFGQSTRFSIDSFFLIYGQVNNSNKGPQLTISSQVQQIFMDNDTFKRATVLERR